MSMVSTEVRDFQTQLLLVLKGSWCIIETSSSYVMGQVRNVDLRNLNLLLSPAAVLLGGSLIRFRSVLVRESDVRKVLTCESEEDCEKKLDIIRKTGSLV